MNQHIVWDESTEDVQMCIIMQKVTDGPSG